MKPVTGNLLDPRKPIIQTNQITHLNSKTSPNCQSNSFNSQIAFVPILASQNVNNETSTLTMASHLPETMQYFVVQSTPNQIYVCQDMANGIPNSLNNASINLYIAPQIQTSCQSPIPVVTNSAMLSKCQPKNASLCQTISQQTPSTIAPSVLQTILPTSIEMVQNPFQTILPPTSQLSEPILIHNSGHLQHQLVIINPSSPQDSTSNSIINENTIQLPVSTSKSHTVSDNKTLIDFDL